MDIKNKRVCIIGAAKSGIAAANLAQSLGALVRISDQQPPEKIERALAGLNERVRVEIESGGHTPAFVTACDLVIASPGVWKSAPPLAWARAAGIPVMGEIEFAWRFCSKPVVAVTGSNGKTTTVTLIARVLEAGGKTVSLCGNIGTPFSSQVLDRRIDIFVVEISSFQLELCQSFRPTVALITNFSRNHLDRHPTMEEYFEAKKRLFMNQTTEDYALLNAADGLVSSLEGQLRSRVLLFNQPGETQNPDHLAAWEAARIFGVKREVAQKVFDDFPGVEHRTEKVRVLDGVTYINDSKATTAESGKWALTLLPGPIIMICGGHDKGDIDLTAVVPLARSKLRKMIILTREEVVRRKLHQAFDGAVPVEDHTDMAAAVASARAQARRGDQVLLSPMFASFDMFDNFEHRGNVFKDIVRGLS